MDGPPFWLTDSRCVGIYVLDDTCPEFRKDNDENNDKDKSSITNIMTTAMPTGRGHRNGFNDVGARGYFLYIILSYLDKLHILRRHNMDSLLALLALCEGNRPVSSGFP